MEKPGMAVVTTPAGEPENLSRKEAFYITASQKPCRKKEWISDIQIDGRTTGSLKGYQESAPTGGHGYPRREGGG